MTKEQLKELLPIMQAWVEGKEVEMLYQDNVWRKLVNPDFTLDPENYRIQPKYRPFKSVEECWNEMQKHQPVGWLKSKLETQTYNSYEISEFSDWEYRFNNYTFADGTPYGIKEG